MSLNVKHVLGAKEISANLAKAGVKIGAHVRRGLIRGGRLLQRESMKVVPVLTGNLKGTADTKAVGAGWGTTVVVYYNTDYAVIVHERTDYAHGTAFNLKHAAKIASAPKGDPYWFNRGPNQIAKFLEKPARDHKSAILRTIVKEARGAFGP